MKFIVTNAQKQKNYDINVNDESKNSPRRIIRKKLKDEDICPECHKNMSECECNKEPQVKDEEVKVTKEQVEALKELMELLPDLKKLLGEDESDKPEKSKKSEKSESEEKESEEEGKEGKEEKKESGKKDEADPEIILEGSDDDKEIVSEEFEFDEEDVIEDEGGNDIHDSVLNPGTIETTVSDSNNDTVSHETEVADAWAKRYDALLNHK